MLWYLPLVSCAAILLWHVSNFRNLCALRDRMYLCCKTDVFQK